MSSLYPLFQPSSLLEVSLNRLKTVPAGQHWHTDTGTVLSAPIPQELKDMYMRSLQLTDISSIYTAGQTDVIDHVLANLPDYPNVQTTYRNYYVSPPVITSYAHYPSDIYLEMLPSAINDRKWLAAIELFEKALAGMTMLPDDTPTSHEDRNSSYVWREFFVLIGQSGYELSAVPHVLQLLRQSSAWLYPVCIPVDQPDGDVESTLNTYDGIPNWIRNSIIYGYISNGHFDLAPAHPDNYYMRRVCAAIRTGQYNLLDNMNLEQNWTIDCAIIEALTSNNSALEYLHTRGCLDKCGLLSYLTFCATKCSGGVKTFKNMLRLLVELKDGIKVCSPHIRDELNRILTTFLNGLRIHLRVKTPIKDYLQEYLLTHNLLMTDVPPLRTIWREDHDLYGPCTSIIRNF